VKLGARFDITAAEQSGRSDATLQVKYERREVMKRAGLPSKKDIKNIGVTSGEANVVSEPKLAPGASRNADMFQFH